MDRFQSSLNDFNNTLEKSKLKLSGRLGIPLGGQQIVEVPNRNSFVYVRLRNNQNEIIQAYNNQVSPAYDLPVLVRREGIFYVIDSVDVGMYESNWPNFSPYLPRHGSTHSFTDDGSGGGDMVWVYGRQFMPMLLIPSGSSGAPNAFLSPFLLRNLSGQWKYIGNTGTPNLTIYNPTGSFGVMVLVYVDISTGNPGFIVNSGSYFVATKTGTADIVSFIPTLSNNPNLIPVSAVRLVSGTFVIGWDNIYDARQYFDIIPTGTSSGGGGGGAGTFGVFGENAGIPLGTGTIFNVVGSRLSLTISGSTLQLTNSPDPQEFIGVFGQNQGTSLGTGTTLNVSGSRLSMSLVGSTLVLTNSPDPIDNIGAFIQDEGVPLGTGTVLNFVGPNVSASVSGTVARIFITGSVGGGSSTPFNGIAVQDEGIPIGTGTTLNFVGAGVVASISGSVVNVLVTGSTGGGIPSGTIQIFNSGTFLGSMDKLNFQYPLAAGFTGTMGYAYLNGFLIAWEDVSAQITGSSVHFNLTGTIALGTDRLYYNGLRQQRTTHYLIDSNGKGFSTLFTGTFGDVLIMEYGNAGAVSQPPNPLAIYDDGVFQGSAQGINFGNGLVASVDANKIAQVSGSSGGVGSGDFVKIQDILLTSATGSFIFTQIPQTYTHLIIKGSLRGTSVGTSQGPIVVTFNGDTNFVNYANGTFHMEISGSFGGQVEAALGTYLCGKINGVNSPSGLFTSEEMEIQDYTNTNKFKSLHRKASMLFSYSASSLSQDHTEATVWRTNPNAITSIRIMADNNTGTFSPQSRLTLYGVS